MNINKLFLENLKAAMEYRDIRVGTVEKTVGVRLGYIARKSKDDSGIPLSVAVALANAVNVPIEQLLDEHFPSKCRAKVLKEQLETIDAKASELNRARKQLEEELKQIEEGTGKGTS